MGILDAVANEYSLKNELATLLKSNQNIFDEPQILESYSKDNSFSSQRKPKCVVKPTNKDEVQSIVKWANLTGTPLVPISSGPPHFRGDTVPSISGSVIVDLSEMKKIIRIDTRNKIAIIEPGVTFPQLQTELAKEGLTITAPLPIRNSKSVLTSLLEREPVLIPRYQWQILDPLRFLEVVWGNGDSLRTGEIGLYSPVEEGKPVEQLAPFGPLQLDYYRLVSGAQGTMGIVVWAAIKCEVLPSLHEFFFVSSDTLEPLIDLLYKLLRFRFGDELFIMNNTNMAYMVGNDLAEINQLKEELPKWILVLGVAGRDRLPKERVEFQKKDITDISQQLGLKVSSRVSFINGKQMETFLNGFDRNIPWKITYKGGCEDIFFLTTLNRTKDFIQSVWKLSQTRKYSTADIGVYLQPVQQGVACHCEFNFPFDPTQYSQVVAMKELYEHASDMLLKQDAFFSRPYGIWANMVYNRDAQGTTTLMKVKEIFDPNNIMNPGRFFWTQTLKSERQGGLE